MKLRIRKKVTLSKIDVPTGEKKELIVIDSWSVKWYSRYGEFHSDITQECAVFTSEDDAKDFAKQLKEAYSLLRHTSKTDVIIAKN